MDGGKGKGLEDDVNFGRTVAPAHTILARVKWERINLGAGQAPPRDAVKMMEWNSKGLSRSSLLLANRSANNEALWRLVGRFEVISYDWEPNVIFAKPNSHVICNLDVAIVEDLGTRTTLGSSSIMRTDTLTCINSDFNTLVEVGYSERRLPNDEAVHSFESERDTFFRSLVFHVQRGRA